MNKIDFPLDVLQANFYNLIDAHVQFEPSKNKNTDGIFILGQDGEKAIKINYKLIIKYTNPTFERLYGMYLMTNNIIFIAESFSASIKKELKENGIQYAELSGNCFIKTNSKTIYIIGNKTVKPNKTKPNRAFSKTGLKVILFYLTEGQGINMPSRQLAQHLNIGYSNIHYVNDGLKELKYLIPKNKNTLVLDNKKELLNRWISNYEEKIKPTLIQGRYKFSDNENLKNWRDMKTEEDFLWGGETGAALFIDHFEPKIYSIYTGVTPSILIKKYKLIPDKEGYIFVYKPFHFSLTSHYLNATHPILIYADLIISKESRNIEMANKIYEKFIQY